MARFVGDDGGQFVFIICIAQQANIDRQLAAGQRPGIDGGICNYNDLPGQRVSL